MTPSTLPSRADIAPFRVMEVMRRAAERVAAGDDVVHLEVGQPGTGAPAGVVAAAHRALDEDVLGYTVALGLPELRTAIGGHLNSWYGVDVDPGRIVVTQGSSGAFVFAFLASFAAGSRVGVPAPGYACYRNMLTALDIEVVDLRVGADEGYVLRPHHLDAAGDLDGVIVASPNNPTGTMLDADELADVASWCADHDVTLISDEIYHGITFTTPAATAIGLPGDPIVVNSFSKYFSMTGWRLGWMVVPEHLVTPIERLAQNLTIAPSSLSQRAALAAFDCTEELEANVARYRLHRGLLLDGLAELGFTDLAPADGAFYVWADVAHLGIDSETLCARWLDELGVATTPGVDFDPIASHRALRFSFAGTTEDVHEALRRLATWPDLKPRSDTMST